MGDIAVPYPWQQDYWGKLIGAEAEKHLPHALMFVGQQGVGKNRIAQAFAHYLLCDDDGKNSQARACGFCKSCQLNTAGTHPDLKMIEPEELGKAIKIDQVRALVTSIQKTAQFDGYRVVIIRPAEALNIAAANALLKTLEEPGEGTVLLLVTNSVSALLPTIKSRCQTVSFNVPAKEKVLPWLTPIVGDADQALHLLRAASDCPLKALEFLDSEWFGKRAETLQDLLAIQAGTMDPLRLAKKWLDYPILELMDWLLIWSVDLLKLQTGVNERVNNPDLLPFLTTLAGQLNSDSAISFGDKVGNVKRESMSSANPNKQLLLEDLLLQWQDA
ncbi:MAG: DNA polymerase III subunit delta' [Pseudomonadales bacterium]|nr:DNA polymerase III subunit delta' [Pseudomonadales bacterium]